VAERVAAALRQMPPRDPTGRYHELARALADEVDADVADVLDEFDARAASRQYDGEASQDEAERLGWADTEERYRRQKELTLCP
jgi:hypothetical protein